jgi:hypothetical protein
VRDYPTEGKGSTWVELTVGREMATRRREDSEGSDGLVTRRGHESEERKGGVSSHGRRRRNGSGRKKGRDDDGAPF